jgi:N-acetylneuraminate synthase
MPQNKFIIDHKNINSAQKPYVIAEMSANHNGNIDKAMKIILSAKESGADAVKMQTYTADTMTINSKKTDFKINHGLWKDKYLFDLYKSAETPFEWQKTLFDYAKEIDITLFSTPFDESAVDILEKLNTPAFKVASFEITDIPLLKYIASTNKPIFISTGLSSEVEISEAIDAIKSVNDCPILLFHCISNYPANLIDTNMSMIKTLQKRFLLPVGLSDHTIGNHAAIIATSLGCCAFEKHFTLDRNDKGPDSEFSIEPQELKILISDITDTWKAMGRGDYDRLESEKSNKIFRRSIYFVKDLKVGEIIDKSHIRRIRPGFAIEPKYYLEVLGKKVSKAVSSGDRVTWDILED